VLDARIGAAAVEAGLVSNLDRGAVRIDLDAVDLEVGRGRDGNRERARQDDDRDDQLASHLGSSLLTAPMGDGTADPTHGSGRSCAQRIAVTCPGQ
jgi:hypothetical protein